MKLTQQPGWVKILIVCTLVFVMGCGPTAKPALTPTLTPTPTVVAQQVITPSPRPESRCNNLSGTLEIKVLVGPAEAAGLEPVAVGEIPFSVQHESGTYAVQGGGPISYHEVLEKEWGTYTVNLEMEAAIAGQCVGDSGSEELHLTVQMSGEQLVEVRSSGFSGDYPWSGTTTNDLVFPLEDGSSQTGEGWEMVLHL